MLPSLDRYRKDLASLIEKGEQLFLLLQLECFPKDYEDLVKEKLGSTALKALKALPTFAEGYQPWYTESKALVRQLLPDRHDDFVRHYEKPKARKEITYENYRIEDCLQGLNVTRGLTKEKVVGPDAAVPQFRQQLAILKSVTTRFESSLYDIRQLVQADLFDSELDASKELAKHKFRRAAGAVAGVVLEKHMAQVCTTHSIKLAKKAPGIADMNSALKAANLIDIPQWRYIQLLADIRNLCDHDKKVEPTEQQIDDLIVGVAKITKTVF